MKRLVEILGSSNGVWTVAAGNWLYHLIGNTEVAGKLAEVDCIRRQPV